MARVKQVGVFDSSCKYVRAVDDKYEYGTLEYRYRGHDVTPDRNYHKQGTASTYEAAMLKNGMVVSEGVTCSPLAMRGY